MTVASTHLWFYWALLSTGFASLTTIFAKVGLEGVDSDFATLIRTFIIQYPTALVFCLGLGFSTAFADDAAEKAAGAAAPAWLKQIDAGEYPASWKDASAYFRGAVTEKSWTDALNGVRKPLGKLLSRKLVKAQSASSLPGAPDGNYVVMQFDASFSNKKGAVETVTFMQEKDGKWKAAGYYIK